MLRITLEEEALSGVMLRLEGSVAGEWAALLERECSGFLRFRGTVGLDLAGVIYVDRTGLEVLARLNRAGVVILCRPGPVASVLEGEGIRVTHDADGADDERA
jgi:anti-anti-sigma regulatory factor